MFFFLCISIIIIIISAYLKFSSEMTLNESHHMY